MTIKKIICATLAALLLATPFTVRAYDSGAADDFYALTGSTGDVSYDLTVFANKEELALAAPSAILVERDTGEVLYEKNADTPRAIASITKVMTMILVMEALEAEKITLDDIVNVSEHAFRMGGSQIWLEPGEQLTVNEMLKAVAVASANDAAVALAEHVSGGEPSFVALMNERAAELGMTQTTFKNSNGLDEPGHISFARDVAEMSREVLRHELVRSYITIWQDHLRGGETELTNTNKMLKSFNGITGIKTGTTDDAGVCISASAERDGMEIIAVVLGCPDSASRFASARTLLEYGFANYELAHIVVDPAELAPIKVKGGETETCALECELPASIVVEKGRAAAVNYEINMAEFVEAPVAAGQQIGAITVLADGEKLGEYPVRACESVGEMTFAKGFAKLFGALMSM